MIYLTDTFGQANFQKHFDSLALKGSTTIYDFKNKKWIYSDSLDAEKETLPASTFKILNSLIALQNKVVSNESQIIKWDSIEKKFFGAKIESWNKDTDLRTAYKNSTVWFYVKIAKEIGRTKYKKILKKCKYGNGNLEEKGIDFWNYGEFAVSPKNQIEFLVKLYKSQLPFSKPTTDKVKELMISEKTKTHTYRDKTGWTRKDGQDIIWWIGYVEMKGNVYFFATRLIKNENENNTNFPKGRKEITKLILKVIESQ
jgi:beta-lactamase class D